MKFVADANPLSLRCMQRAVPGMPGLAYSRSCSERDGGTVFYDPRRYRFYAGSLWRIVGGTAVNPSLYRAFHDDLRELRGLGVPAPIPGQPGLFREMGGLGSLETLGVKLTTTRAQYDAVKSRAMRMIAVFPPLRADSLKSLAESLQRLAATGASAQIGAAEYAGIVRFGLASAIGNIARAQALIDGGRMATAERWTMSRETLVNLLLTKAKATLDALDALSSATHSAADAIARGIRAVSLGDLGQMGWDDIIVVTVILVVAAGLLYAIFRTGWASIRASQSADQACAQDAAAGHPCTGGDWTRYRGEAQGQEGALSPFPDLAPLFREAGSLLFWGGLLAVGAALAYGAWVAQPSAVIVRERLRTRAAA